MTVDPDPTLAAPDTQLCTVCFSFDRETLEARKHVDHSLPCSLLFESAAKGCKTCEILAKAIQSTYPVEKPEKTHFGWYVGSAYSEAWSPRHRPCTSLYLWDPEGEDTAKIPIELFRHHNAPCPWPFFLEEYPIPPHTASEESCAWVADKLERCVANHAKCTAGPDPSPLPTRVLDVGINSAHDDPVRVLETNGLRGKYLTLSHCWGNPDLMPTKLTARTLEAYKEGISFHSLPQTFQDAVTFTRKMSIQYVWIDSLCIIQPDGDQDRSLSDQDWEREISRIGGLLFDIKTTDISIPGAAAGPTYKHPAYQIFARKSPKHLQSHWPLMKRGWVAQEYFLSPRTLLFTDTELVWRCRQQQTCQCRGGPASEMPWEYCKLLEPTAATTPPTRDELARLWYTLINSYSAASLSFQTDKLAAVDGIVQYMRPLRKSENLAGLWVDTFVLDLLWMPGLKAKRSRLRTVEPSMTRLRPVWSTPEHLFPTWSWASVPYNVCWPGSVNYPYPLPKVPLPGGTFVNLVRDGDRRPNEVTVRGTLVTARLGELRKNPEGKKMWYFSDCEDEDVLGDDTAVHCLRVLQEGNEYYSLALRCRDKVRNVYERLGVLIGRREEDGDITPAKWWEPSEGWRGEEVTLTLV